MKNKDLVDLIAPGGEPLTYPSMGQECYETLKREYEKYPHASIENKFFSYEWDELLPRDREAFEVAAGAVMSLVVLAASNDALEITVDGVEADV